MYLILDVIILLVSIFLFGVTFTFNTINIESGGGGAFWPRILLGLVILLELGNIIYTYIKNKKGETRVEKDPEIVYPQNLYTSVGLIVGFIILMNMIGFFLATVLYLFFMMLILKVKNLRNVIISIVGAYGISFVFVVLLMVPLPQGISIFRTISSILGL
ncbi:MAG: tripartite tricarboxylate transporter TctB family protein [Clostridiaceae bacterium]